MAAQLDHTSAVVRGFWNPFIITPDWLRKCGVVEGTLEPKPLPASEAPFAFELGALRWEPGPDRLAIISTRGENCGLYAKRVLDHLPHTPIQAIGINFVYKAVIEAWPAQHLPRIGEVSLGRHGPLNLKQVRWVGLAELDADTILNLTVSQAPREVICSFNFHRNVDDARKAAELASKWSDDRDQAARLLRNLFGVETQ